MAEAVIGVGCPQRLGLGQLSQGQFRQHVQSGADIQEPGVRVRVGCQRGRAVPHCGLGGAEGNAAFAQVGAESGPQGMYVDGPAPVIPLIDLHLARLLILHTFGDAGEDQIAVEDAEQAGRQIEQPSLRRQRQRNRLPVLRGPVLTRMELVGQPSPQVGREVIPERNLRPLAILLITGIQAKVRHLGIQIDVAGHDGGKLPLAQAGQDQGLVDQRPLTPHLLHPGHEVGSLGQSQSPTCSRLHHGVDC